MKSANLTKHKKKPVRKSKRCELLSVQLKAIAIVIILLFLTMLGGCSTANRTHNIKELCVKDIVTYGDALECAIKLNEVQQ